MNPRPSIVTWHTAENLPDADTTVLIHCPDLDEPVWLGYHDGETWRAVDGGKITKDGVQHWADMPEGPQP